MYRLTPEELLRAYPEIDFLVAEGHVSSRYMVSFHRAFYQFAADQFTGGVVLDAGCGTAFGTEILSRSADRVVGIDLKEKVLRYGREQYGRCGLHFTAMDATSIGFADRSFDVVVADELLEHMPEHRPFLAEATRILKRAGVFICATVNPAHTFGHLDNPLNRNHFREFDAAAFKAELARYFDDVALFGQGFGEGFRNYLHSAPARGIEWVLLQLKIKHRIPARWRARVRNVMTGVKADGCELDEFRVTDSAVEDALYIVAVARGRGGITSGV